MYPCDVYGRQAPGLYTYYAIMSLLVVILAISLIWIPFVQLITEINTIIARMVIYLNTELLGYKNASLSNALEILFLSQQSLVMISVCCVAYALYLASGDFLLFAGCYICNLPNIKYLNQLKNLALRVIEYLLHLTGKKKVFFVKQNIPVNHYHHHHA